MQKILLFLLIPFLSFAQQEWKEFHDDSLRFSVKSPFAFDKKVNTAMTDFGLQEVISYGIKAPEGHSNYLYQIMIIPYPDSVFHEGNSEFQNTVVQEFINASHDFENVEKIYQTSTKVNGDTFQQWVIHHGEEFSIKSRATIKNDALYVVQVITEFDQSVNTNINKFLNSFNFLE